jgi:hypothetical protein
MSKNRAPTGAASPFPSRVGYYCWAGPGTIRMLRLKYGHPPIDEGSLLSSYDLPALQRLKSVLRVSDCWATYSWGFAEATEREDRAFLRAKLENFHRACVRVHAYVQGPNLVYADFADRDWFCRDVRGSLIAYHRGRKVVCVNNPGFREFLAGRVRAACREEVDGVFIDNVWLGQLGLPHGRGRTRGHVGCRCEACQSAFRKQTGSAIPSPRQDPALFEEYLAFRVRSVTAFLRGLRDIAHEHGKEFGSNSLDPRLDTRFVFGVDLSEVDRLQDYTLFEALSLPNPAHVRNNHRVGALRASGVLRKPTFVVSYKRGIGFDAPWSQEDVDAIFAESRALGFYPCIKGSEFVSGGRWHNLRPEGYRAPRSRRPLVIRPVPRRRRPFLHAALRLAEGRLNTLATFYYEHAWTKRYFNWCERLLLKP